MFINYKITELTLQDARINKTSEATTLFDDHLEVRF
jgi:hypothetical protein